MAQFSELLQMPEQAETSGEAKGRRRAGRPDQVSPDLLPLLRNAATVEISALSLEEVDAPSLENEFGAIRGIFFGLALSVPLWTIIVAVVWAVLR